MPEIVNCPNCDKIMMKNKFRDICDECYKEEEKMFEVVNKFMRKRENRAATIRQVIEATEIDEDLLLKFIRTGRLKLTNFPNLGYPCDKCGAIIRTGKLCESCASKLKEQLAIHEREEERLEELKKSEKGTYLAGKRED